MPLDGKDYLDGKPHFIYTFIERDTGRNIHVDSELLRQWCAANRSTLEVVLTPVEERIAKTFLTGNVIDVDHVVEVGQMKHLDPIIYGITEIGANGHPDVLLIDGHHRYFLAAVKGEPLIPSYLLKPEQWKPFEIIGLPSQTEDELIATPTKAQYLRSKAQ